jgi:hypothetical protein
MVLQIKGARQRDYLLFDRLTKFGSLLAWPLFQPVSFHVTGERMIPAHFEELSEKDKRGYELLRVSLRASAVRYARQKSLETFQNVMNRIRVFVTGTDDDQWKRGCVCGICWFSDSIAINIHELAMLTSKCRSSINGLFQSLGYGIVPHASEAAAPLPAHLPFLRNNFAELRKWTVRQKYVREPTMAPQSGDIDASDPALPVKPGSEGSSEGLWQSDVLWSKTDSLFSDPFPFLDSGEF